MHAGDSSKVKGQGPVLAHAQGLLWLATMLDLAATI